MSQPDEPYDPAPMPRRFYAGHPDDDAPEFHLGEYSPRPAFARRPTRDRLRELEAALDSLCPSCGSVHDGLCQKAMDAPLTPENLLLLGGILHAAPPAAVPATRPAETHGASPSLTGESPVPAGTHK